MANSKRKCGGCQERFRPDREFPGTIKYDAGHFIPAGSCTALRFDERNCHRQCSVVCNVHKSGNRSEYERALVAKYGQHTVDFLNGPQPTIKITVDFYKEIEMKYKEKNKAIQALITNNVV